jgi:hypothetical protein
VPPKNPIGKIKDVATDAAVTVAGTVSGTVKDPIGTGQKVVGTAIGQAVAVAGRVSSSLPGRRGAAAPKTESRPGAEPQAEPRKDQGDPLKPAAKTTAKKAPAKKAPAKKTAAKKAPAKKAAAKKTAAKKAPAKKAADLANVEDSSVETPVGTTGADAASNPDTTESDLQQVGTEPLLDPSLTNAVKSEADTAARAADVEKG